MAPRKERVSADQVREGAVLVGGQSMVPIEDEEFNGIPGGEVGGSVIPLPIPPMPQPELQNASNYVPLSKRGAVAQMPQGMMDPHQFYDGVDADEMIFPGGPPRCFVEMWKAQYGEVYSSTFGDEVFIWRTMRRQEYKEVLRLKVPNGDTMFREENICTRCVLWPMGYSHLNIVGGKAGVPTLLAEQIMDKSGFSPTDEPQRL